MSSDPPRHRVAFVDCGTNTFALHVARLEGNEWKTVFKQRRLVRLGHDSFRTGRISPERMRRGVDALKSFRETALNYGVTHLRAVGCSALRDASNRDVFVGLAQDVGWPLEIIDGDREAMWIHLGVADTVDAAALGQKEAWTLDIGGGSVECILWNARQVHGHFSLDLGVARLNDWIKPSDPMTPKDVQSLRQIVDQAMAPVLASMASRPPEWLVGTSGAFDTLAFLENPAAGQQNPRKADALPLSTLVSRCQAFALSTKTDLSSNPQIHPDRIPYMALACALIDRMLELVPSIKEVRRSRHTLAEGVLTESARSHAASGLSPSWRRI